MGIPVGAQFYMKTNTKGQTITKFGSGAVQCNRYALSSFASSLSKKMKTTKVVIAFNLSINHLRDIALYSVLTVGKDSRFIDEPIPLPYFSNFIRNSNYKYGIYLKYVNRTECEIICLEEGGHRMGKSMVNRFTYPTPNTDDKKDYSHLAPQFSFNDIRFMDRVFITALIESLYSSDMDVLHKSQIVFIHSALNGCTARVFRMCFHALGFKNIFFVDEESLPSDCAVNSFGNKSNSLKKGAEDLAQLRGASVIFLNNSDGTKILVYEFDGIKFTPFSDEELTLLFGWWALLHYKCKKEHRRIDPDKSWSRKLDYEKMPLLFDCQEKKVTENMAKMENLEAIHCLNDYDVLDKIYSNQMDRFDKLMKMTSHRRTVNYLPVPILLAIGKDYQFMCNPEIIPIWDGIGAAIQIVEMATYLRAVDRTSLRNHLTAIKIHYGI